MRTGVGLVGAGMVAPTYLDAISGLPDVDLRGVLATTADSARRLLATHPGLEARAYGSIDELVDDELVDIVIIATPPNARRDLVDAASAAGKHLLLEKPIERTLDAAAELCDVGDRAGVTMGVVLQHRAKPVLDDLRSLVADGDLGRLVMVEIDIPWWRPQTYYDEPGRGTYERDGGGVLISQAIHTLDLALTLSPPVVGVTALTATTAAHSMESEDVVVAGLEFSGGAVGKLFASTAAYPGRSESIRLHHTEATATLRSTELLVEWRDGTTDTFGTGSTTGSGADPMAFGSDLHRAVISDFADAVADRRAPLAPARDALEVHRVIEAVERSGRSRRHEPVTDPDRRTGPS